MPRTDIYAQTTTIGGASPRETEILAFGLCNARLGRATDPVARIEALHKTHQLWSMLVRDLAAEGNRLPGPVRQQLIELGFWAMHYSLTAMGRPLSLQPLIDVNQNIMEGLRAQASGSGAISRKALTEEPGGLSLGYSS